MLRRTIIVLALGLTATAAGCERKGSSTNPDEAANDDSQAGDDGTAPDGDDEGDDGEAEGGDDKPPVVEHVLKVEGGLTVTQAQAVVDEHVREIRACFDEAIARNPNEGLTGAIVIAVSVAPTGQAGETKADANELGDDEAAACIAREVAKWTFPKPKGGKATIHYPFYPRSY